MTTKLMFGDCLELMKTITNNSIDAVIGDPPYGTTNCEWDSPINLTDLWSQLKRIVKPNGPIVLCAQTPFDKVLGCSNLPWLRYEWIWEKTNATGHYNAKKMPMKAHENILVFYDKLPVYNPQKTKGHKRKTSTRKGEYSKIYNQSDKTVSYDSDERYPRSVQVFSSDKQKSNLIETQKPVDLMKYMVKTYTKEGDTILDFSMGSGTTGVACKELERNFIGMENNIINFRKCVDRLKPLPKLKDV